MFKLHKPHLSGSIHSGHFMVSRLDDDDEDDDNHDPADDSSESERDNANSVEIDVNNPDSVVDARDINYRVESPSTKDEHLTSWNDLDRPTKHSQKQHQYLTYYTNSYTETNGCRKKITCSTSSSNITNDIVDTGCVNDGIASASNQLHRSTNAIIPNPLHHNGIFLDPDNENSKGFLTKGINSQLNHLHQHHQHIQDGDQMIQLQIQPPHNHQHNHQQQGHQHAVTIDTSLTKLLQCMSLYYSSKLTSPKWKSFKGLKLRLKYKIRLNNLIWRAWFLQCIRGRRPPGCQFTAPVETDVHKKSETIVLEGKYWKRKEKAIVDEYKKWRTFHKQKSQMICFRPSSFDWDSRVSNLASSSLFGQEYHFCPDYDMNITYNLDDLPPMIEETDTREADNYYQQQAPMRMIEQHPQINQQQQQLQEQHLHQQQQQQQLHHHHQQQQQHLHQLQQHQHLVQLQVSASSNSQQAISLKREQPLVNQPKHQHIHQHALSQPQTHQHHQHHHHHQQQLQQQQQHQHQQQPQQLHYQRPPTLPFNLDSAPLYQQLNHQLQQQTMQPQLAIPAQHSPSPQQAEQQQHQNLQEQNTVMSISPELFNYGGSGSGQRNEQRRVCHINAEQKRRCNIKNGFDTLKSILPSMSQNVNVKISKASMLQKAALYISSLSAEQKQLIDEKLLLKQQIDALKQTINAYQCQLPASGGPVGCQGSSQAREMLQDYVKKRTLDNWKFWIFSLLIEPLFDSYYNSVSTNSLEDSCKTIFTWLDRNCGLVSLRKEVLESLTFLSTRTNILNTPQTLPTEAVDAVRYQSVQTSNIPQQPSPAIATTSRLQHQESQQMLDQQMIASQQQHQQTQQQQNLNQHIQTIRSATLW